jgi:hypothetical protein
VRSLIEFLCKQGDENVTLCPDSKLKTAAEGIRKKFVRDIGSLTREITQNGEKVIHLACTFQCNPRKCEPGNSSKCHHYAHPKSGSYFE